MHRKKNNKIPMKSPRPNLTWTALFAKIDKLKKEEQKLQKQRKSKEAFVKKIINPVTRWEDLR